MSVKFWYYVLHDFIISIAVFQFVADQCKEIEIKLIRRQDSKVRNKCSYYWLQLIVLLIYLCKFCIGKIIINDDDGGDDFGLTICDDECNYWLLYHLFIYSCIYYLQLIQFYRFNLFSVLMIIFIIHRFIHFIYLSVYLFTYCSSCESYFNISFYQ